MQGRTNAGGTGGFGLNLKIVNGATMPSNPRENTVWVETTVAIKSYAIQISAPENPTEGMLFLKNKEGVGVEVNIGKKNPLNVRLSAAQLYTGGKWTNLNAYIYMNGEWKRFATKLTPAEYTAVEYIQGTGTQYIKTGLTGFTYLHGFEIDYICQSSVAATTDGTGNFFGAYKSDYHKFLCGTYGGGEFKVYNRTYGMRNTVKRGIRQQIAKHLAILTLPDGQTITVDQSTSNTETIAIFVFGRNNNGKIAALCKYQLFSLKFYDANDELISDLVPCYRNSDNVAGLWDRIREVFLTNAGTGIFAVGEAIT